MSIFRSSTRLQVSLMIFLVIAMMLTGCQPAQPTVAVAAPTQPPANPASTAPTSATTGSATVAPAATTVATAVPTIPPTPGPTTAVTDQKNTLVVAIDSDPANLEPGTNLAYPTGSEIILNVFDTLVAWAPPDFAKLEGRLAQSWTVSPDGLTYTFKLRPDVKFQDGTDFNADAVKSSFERTLKLNSYMKAYFGVIKTITVVDPLTVSLTLDHPLAVFLSWLAMPQAAIVSPTAVQKYGDSFNVHPVGTGAFQFVSYTPDTEVVLKANPNYFRGAPKLSQIIYRIIPQASTRRLEIESGRADIVQQNGQLFSLPVEDIKALKANPQIEVLQVPSQIIRQLEFNNSNANSPVANIKVRQAIAYAIDYDGLLSGVLGNTASRVYGPLTSNSWGFDPKVKDFIPTRDVNKAKQLLQEAGYASGQLKLNLYTFQGSSWQAIGTFLQANLADVGIGVTIKQMDFPSLSALHKAGQFDICLDGRQPWYNDPDAHITIGYLSSLASTAMTFRMTQDQTLDQMILDAQSASDQSKRKDLYFSIQEQLMAKVPAAYLFSPDIIIYKRANVKGLVVNSAPPLNEYWAVYKEQ